MILTVFNMVVAAICFYQSYYLLNNNILGWCGVMLLLGCVNLYYVFEDIIKKG